MARSVLIVEDEDTARRGYANELTANGWSVCAAADVAAGLSHLRADGPFDVLLLDLRIQREDGSVEHGSDLLTLAKAEGLPLPVVVVLSGHLNAASMDRCLNLGVHAEVEKPLSLAALPGFLEAFCGGMDTAPLTVEGLPGPTEAQLVRRGDQQMLVYLTAFDRPADAQVTSNPELLLSREIRKREEALSLFIRDRAREPFPASISEHVERRSGADSAGERSGGNCHLQPAADEPLLVIARRWNSWYPSYFEVDGGAYAILGARAVDARVRGALVDPGFKAMSVLNRLGVSVGCLDTCVITHNHPDHVGGFFEYAAARHAAGQSTVAFCSQSVASMLGTYAGSLHVGPFDRTGVEIVPPYSLANGRVPMRVIATPVVTSHHTVGHVEGTRGILLSIESPGVAGHFDARSTALLLGDTEYQSDPDHVNAGIFNGMRAAFSRSNLSVAVLHIGCCQYKESPGKHLYLTGLVDILRDIEHYRQTHGLRPPAKRLLVLVSEWGLEHATRKQVLGALARGVPLDVAQHFDDVSRVQRTIEVIRRAHHYETIDLIPADEGLTVGLISGAIYLDGAPTQPSQVRCRPNAKGLEYFTQESIEVGRSDSTESHVEASAES